jgi:hypothetical protein
VDQFDKDLRYALKRRTPPASFTEQILAKSRLSVGKRRLLHWRWAMAAAAALVLGAGLLSYRAHLRRIEGERTKEQVMFALRVTGSTLRNIQDRIVRSERQAIEIPGK